MPLVGRRADGRLSVIHRLVPAGLDQEAPFIAAVHDFLADAREQGLLRDGTQQWLHAPFDLWRRWQAALFAHGWSAPHWPTEYGGPGWTPLQRFLFEVEAVSGGAPVLPALGLKLAAPVIYTYGNAEQKARYLPGILSGEEQWCQGFSEPGAGSDLGSLKTRAVLDGDHYVINGQKTWTTYAQFADMMFCLARTGDSGSASRDISFFLIDMKTPGISISPIMTIDWDHHVNSVFLDDVRVPAANLVGAEGEGWRYARFLLGNERTGAAKVPEIVRDLNLIRSLLDRRPGAVGQASQRAELAQCEIELTALTWSVLRLLHDTEKVLPPTMASTLKVRGAELQQRVAKLAAGCVGGALRTFSSAHASEAQLPANSGDVSGVAPYLMFRRVASIYAGADEIQRDIIANSVIDR